MVDAPTAQLYTYHYNGIGSTVAITDAAKTIVNKYFYSPFGQLTNQIETIPQPFKYAGRYGVMREPNNLYYMRARYYDADTGRFISEDPSGFNGGINLYAYANNNPVNLIDPLGLEAGSSGWTEAWDVITDFSDIAADMFELGGGKMLLTAFGDLNAATFPIARALAKTGGAALSGVTLGTDMTQLIVAVQQGASLSTVIHHGALVTSDVISYFGLHPALKPLRWVGALAHTWDTATQQWANEIYGVQDE